MYSDKRILAVIAARAGSKGLPGKNVMIAGGKPLIAWSIKAAQEATLLDRTILSTDCPRSMEIAAGMGCAVPFVRPAELARDDSSIMDVVLHALDTVGMTFDYVVLLQATSPLRRGSDIDGAIRTCIDTGAATCISVNEPPKSPYWMFTMDGAGRLQPLMGHEHASKRRQELPVVYAPNGAVYVAQVDWFRQNRRFVGDDTVPFVMPYERSIDIDQITDIHLFEALLSTAQGERPDEFFPQRQLHAEEDAAEAE